MESNEFLFVFAMGSDIMKPHFKDFKEFYEKTYNEKKD
jgi:hypothetical protein